MFKSKRNRITATCAFCFGVAFSLSAFANNCASCWDGCFAERRACRAEGHPASECQAIFNACGNICGCPIP
ncbi:hypothetical protein [Lysobacter sp. CA199]|uniref:hypothetical protein n=1 Tax=Lysobacter sp. CA199 TaxID=3455608 RepID=UPI003F8D1928